MPRRDHYTPSRTREIVSETPSLKSCLNFSTLTMRILRRILDAEPISKSGDPISLLKGGVERAGARSQSGSRTAEEHFEGERRV